MLRQNFIWNTVSFLKPLFKEAAKKLKNSEQLTKRVPLYKSHNNFGAQHMYFLSIWYLQKSQWEPKFIDPCFHDYKYLEMALSNFCKERIKNVKPSYLLDKSWCTIIMSRLMSKINLEIYLWH